MTKQQLARMLDHTILKAEATGEQVRQTILYARESGCASVCTNGCWVETAAELLLGSETISCVTIGFPLGAATTYAKAKEAEQAYQNGARELDMVQNIAWLKDADFARVQADIEAVVNASPGRVKVILETCYLTSEEIVTACKIAEAAGAAFVKTSTGFGSGGATAEHVRLMRQSVGPTVEVKASGGIASLADALTMIEAGASRLGVSRTAQILAELEA